MSKNISQLKYYQMVLYTIKNYIKRYIKNTHSVYIIYIIYNIQYIYYITYNIKFQLTSKSTNNTEHNKFKLNILEG